MKQLFVVEKFKGRYEKCSDDAEEIMHATLTYQSCVTEVMVWPHLCVCRIEDGTVMSSKMLLNATY